MISIVVSYIMSTHIMYYISPDLIFIDYCGKTLAYNVELNKAVIVNEKTKNILQNGVGMGRQVKLENELLSSEELMQLKNGGALYSDTREYENNKYSHRLISRNPVVDIQDIYFHITQHCNLNCEYCYNKKNLGKSDKLSTGEVNQALLQLKRSGAKKIIFTGGEPLLRNDIIQIAEISQSLGFSNDLLTNGILLKEKIEILEYVDNVIVSLDTLHEEENRRKGLDIPGLLCDLSEINKKYAGKIIIRSVLSSSNKNSWKEVEAFALRNGYKHKMTLYLPDSLEDVNKMIDIESFEPAYDSEIMTYGGSLCGACYKRVAIDSNGDIYPCQNLIKERYRIANVKDAGWFELVKKSAITKCFMELDVLKFEHCRECTYRYICGGGCRAIADNVYGTPDAYLQFFCPYLKKVAEGQLRELVVKYG